ncbi:MAG: ABC transporter ATP-binding protein, partial [Desulfuromonadales bacterium]|nr:ABC transporter ATP-binding protein [Desulfuromonadales bacterium]
DEPTNHLDLASKEVLLNALKGYSGTMVFVSHDRYFVDALATRVVEVADSRATVYLGNYEDFLRAKAGEGDASHSSLRVEQAGATGGSTTRDPAIGADKAMRVASHAERKAARREEQRRQKQLHQVEARIEELEVQLAELTGEMQDPVMAVDHGRLGKLIDQHAELQSELDDCMARWEALQETVAAGGAS